MFLGSGQKQYSVSNPALEIRKESEFDFLFPLVRLVPLRMNSS